MKESKSFVKDEKDEAFKSNQTIIVLFIHLEPPSLLFCCWIQIPRTRAKPLNVRGRLGKDNNIGRVPVLVGE